MSVYENVHVRAPRAYEWMKCTIWTSDLIKLFYSIRLNYFNNISYRCKFYYPDISLQKNVNILGSIF